MNHKTFVESDKFFNKPELKADMSWPGEDVIPTDINSAFVPETKDGAQNLENAQASIRKRFSLGR